MRTQAPSQGAPAIGGDAEGRATVDGVQIHRGTRFAAVHVRVVHARQRNSTRSASLPRLRWHGNERKAADLLKRGKAKAINQMEKWDDDDSETRDVRLAAFNQLDNFKRNVISKQKVPSLLICRSLPEDGKLQSCTE